MIKQRFSGKKAYSGVVVAIILGCIVIVVLLFMAYRITTKNVESLQTATCRNSVIAHSAILEATKLGAVTDIKCPTRYPKVDNSNELKAKEFIAEDMHKCWYEWLQGNATLYKANGIFCHICTVYDFRQKGQRIEGLTKYLVENHIQKRWAQDNPGLTYAKYFAGFATDNANEQIPDVNIQKFTEVDYINTDYKYATIVVDAVGSDTISTALNNIGRTNIGAGGGVLIFAGGIVLVTVCFGTGGLACMVAGTVGTLTGGGAISEALFGGHPPEHKMFMVFREYSPDSLANLKCQESNENQQSHSTGKTTE